VSGKGTLKTFKAMLAEAKLPEATVLICLRGDLAADHETAERELEQAEKRGADSLAGSGVGELVDRIEALEADMREHTYEFRLRALPRPQWRQLCTEHPPRKAEDGSVVDTDRIGVNAETFYDAIIRACLIDPELTDQEFEQLVGALTDRQFDELADAAWGLNRREVDVPFSHAASRMKRASSGE
jgi:hypothetical protein